MDETLQQARLTHMRRIATGLLLLMALLLVLARLGQRQFPGLGLVAAFSEAAMVGALADWFAVSALFRRPLGLPIPHSAVIPNNKERIGKSISNFLETHFLTSEVVRAELSRVDFCGSAAAWLGRPHNRRAVAEQAVAALPALLRLFDERQAAGFLHAALAGTVREVRLAPLLARVLDALVQGRQHHILLERMLGIVARALERNRPLIRQKVYEHSPRWVPRAVDDQLYERLMEAVYQTLHEIQGADSEWRGRFQSATEELVARLSTSPEHEARLQELLARSLSHPGLHDYTQQVWHDLCARLLDQQAAPQLTAHAERALAAFGAALGRDSGLQERLNRWLVELAADIIVARRAALGAVVQRVVRAWDGETVARRFELYIGRDLQFIRINGTLVGGAVGVALHALGSLA